MEIIIGVGVIAVLLVVGVVVWRKFPVGNNDRADGVE